MKIEGEPPSQDILMAIATASGLLGDERYREEAGALHRLMPVCELDAADAFEFIFRFSLDLAFGYLNGFRISKFANSDVDQAGIMLRGMQAIRAWPELFMDMTHEPETLVGQHVRDRSVSDTYLRKLWQAAIDDWLAKLPPERGKTIREFVKANPLFDKKAKWMASEGKWKTSADSGRQPFPKS